MPVVQVPESAIATLQSGVESGRLAEVYATTAAIPFLPQQGKELTILWSAVVGDVAKLAEVRPQPVCSCLPCRLTTRVQMCTSTAGRTTTPRPRTNTLPPPTHTHTLTALPPTYRCHPVAHGHRVAGGRQVP